MSRRRFNWQHVLRDDTVRRHESILQGLKPGFSAGEERPKAEALGYLEAGALNPLDGLSEREGRPKAEALGYLEARALNPLDGLSEREERPKAEALGYLEARALNDLPGRRDGYGVRTFWSIRRGVQAALLGVVVVVMLGAGTSRFDRLGHEMICTCGCTQILLECNHVGCPVSPVMIGELQEQLAGGGGDTAVENWFAAKYGAIVLAAPIRGGFDNVAWIVPISVFLLATLGTGAVVWVWRRRTLRLMRGTGCGGVLDDFSGQEFDADPEDAAVRERIRRETEYR
jgi:cytochrome c-type biogenesis protein CcmH/NrfF